MKKRIRCCFQLCFWLTSLFLVFTVTACGEGDGGATNEEQIGMVKDELQVFNALNPNGLAFDALASITLAPAALAPNILREDALAPSVRAAIEESGDDGVLPRQLLMYIVGCALNRTQSFSFSWTDAMGFVHNETYTGLLGLAPSWIDEPLSVSGQKWVSACVASRVNRYGVSVVLSARSLHSALRVETNAIERAAFPMQEGAFWGNLFVDPPYLRACHHEPHDANSRLLFRDCAAGHVDSQGAIMGCEPIRIVGACDSVCDRLDLTSGARSVCRDEAGRLSFHVITIFLPLASH